ncbi:MAG: gliding motility-associated C-terminal domain-containing protein [Janthinobacterium lividum]
MQLLSSFMLPRWGSGWLLGLLLLSLSWLLPGVAQATHLRAGDIQAKVDTTAAHNPNRIFFKLTLYRDPTRIQQPAVTVFYGDGKNSGINTIPLVSEVKVFDDVSIMTYTFEHTYPGSGSYLVSLVEVNRVADVRNIPGSVNQSFYISTRITVDPGLGLNHEPVLRAPAIDKAAVGQVFLHNPAAYDQDGDSLAFHLMPSQQVPGGYPNPIPTNYNPVPQVCTGFSYPNDPNIKAGGVSATQVAYGGVPPGVPGAAAIFVQDPRTGQITWNAPILTGFYNVAFVVEEWRRNAFGAIKIGEVIRDMEIDVVSTANVRPTITIPADTCVVAGTTISKNITAVDGVGPGYPATAVQLFAYGGILPPAAFVQSTQGPPRAIGRFQWTPQCENISKEPYLVVFKAQDTPHTPVQLNDPPLIDEKTWRITVIGPAPTGVTATVNTNQRVLLTWDRYYCQTSSQPNVLPTILIFRRENSFPFTPGPCQTGLPAGSGYVQIGSVSANQSSFIDENIVRGRNYCYRIYVTFPLPGGGASLASAETCVTLSGRSAQLTNVDVQTTDATTGQIGVKWTQPRPNVGSFNAPLGYRLSRSTGGAPFALVTTKTTLADTTFTDTNLNTLSNQYTYQLVFFNAATTQPGSAETTETSPTATSVRLAIVPDGLNLLNTLTWTYTVPWDNSAKPTTIYRRIGTTGAYIQVATVTPTAGSTSATYVDRGLVRGTNYCYYVQTTGQYATPVNSLGQPIYPTLLNRSQEICAILNPTPCTPVLTLTPTNCDSLAALPSFPATGQLYQNRLRWTLGNTPAGCSSDVAYFRIYYRSTVDGPLVLLDSTTQYTYLHRQLPNAAGCYAVQAVNAAKVRSSLSNVACQDNCVFFLLPNIFTPNGDDVNEKFRPKTASPILRTHVQIFNRWGRKVYESDQDPLINWDGGGPAGEVGTSGKVADGIYYYLAEVEFADFAATKRTFKGWVEIIR